MPKINWLVRVRNKSFWLAIIPATIVLARAILAPFGVSLDLSVLGDQLKDIVEAAFAVLVVIGVVNDPTTATLSDSAQALGYVHPRES